MMVNNNHSKLFICHSPVILLGLYISTNTNSTTTSEH